MTLLQMMIGRWSLKLPYRWRRYLLWVLHIFDPYLCIVFGWLHNLSKMIACMTYEGALSEPEDFPKTEEPVWLLGKEYSTQTDLAALRSDVQSRLWMTYRRNFAQIGDSNFTSDKGWGCMLRCGQMVLAEALIRRHLGRDWTWESSTSDETYLRILSLFEDHKCATFSLHIMSQLGVDEGKQIGEWYGPNTVAQVIRKLVIFDEWNNFSVNVALDNIVIMDEIKCSCQVEGERGWRPLLLFIPLRLGLSEMNPVYYSGIKKCFKMPQSLGLIGGKPNHASYFIGFVGDEVVYLDPHTTQEAGSVAKKATETEVETDKSYHCMYAQRMPFEHLDPSLALCFYCGTEKEYDDLCNRMRQELIDAEKTPLFELVPTRPDYMKDDSSLEGASGRCMELEDHHLESEDDEEFEVLQ
ncbi:cysteine protease ATG4B isoform X1 [Penaeus vannamei]|uniref:Cysteine protease n=3 Tax=Penaeus vannamei TaxID=6689 RepID=A0A4D6DM26_PENVA|nr:cysteine protease ATG4B-like isoform X1 [Penaeus vannamei]QBZ67171.1 Atg4 [Penaeus vannamei]